MVLFRANPLMNSIGSVAGGIRAGRDAIKRCGGTAVVEWKVFKKPGETFSYLEPADLPLNAHWTALPWSKNPSVSQYINNYDTIEKPPLDMERKLNPRAFTRIHTVEGERLSIEAHKEFFKELDKQLSAELKPAPKPPALRSGASRDGSPPRNHSAMINKSLDLQSLQSSQ